MGEPLSTGHGLNKIVIWEPQRQFSKAEVLEAVATRRVDFPSAGLLPGARVLIVCHSQAETVFDALALRDCSVVPVSSGLTVGERQALAQRFGLEAIVELGNVTATGEPGPESTIVDHGETPVLGLLSSGSTGSPKLVWRNAQQVRAAGSIFRKSLGLTADDCIMAVIPLEHSYGYQNLMLAALGAIEESGDDCSTDDELVRLAFPRTHHPRSVARCAEPSGTTIFPGAPAFLDMMTRMVEPEGLAKSVRICLSVGTALSTRIHRDFTQHFGVPLWQSYGASEAGPVCLNRDGGVFGDLMDLGAVCDGVVVRIVDKDGVDLPDGEEGELIIESPAVGMRYEGNHDGASRILPGFFHSGDLGIREGGRLRFSGRRKLLISVAGNKVDPLEVEEVLRLHPDVEDVAVVAALGEDAREWVKALVVPRKQMSALNLMDFCSQKLAAYKVPRLIEFRSELPRNSMGKLQRDKLKP